MNLLGSLNILLNASLKEFSFASDVFFQNFSLLIAHSGAKPTLSQNYLC